MEEAPLEDVLRNADFVRRVARTLARDGHEADDVAQDALLKALLLPPSAGIRLRSWLRGVTRNTFRMRRRGEERRSRRERRSARSGPEPSAAERVERLELRRRLVEAISGLPEPYRSTLVLRFYEQCPPVEIARRTATPLNTVKTRLRRGLDRLRVALSDAGEPKETRPPGAGPAGARAMAAGPRRGRGHSRWGALLSPARHPLAAAALVALSAAAFRPLLEAGDRPSPPVAPRTPVGRAAPAGPGKPVGLVADEAAGRSADVPPASGAAESGRAVRAGLRGTVWGGDGRPVAGAEVSVDPGPLVRLVGALGGPAPATLRAATGADGRFRIEGAGDVGRKLVVSARGYRTARRTAPLGGAPVSIRLDPGRGISGRVVDAETRRGLSGFPVWARPSGDGPAVPRNSATDESGAFAFEDLPEGDWSLYFGLDTQDGTRPWEDYGIRRLTRVAAGTEGLLVEVVRGLPVDGTLFDPEGSPAPPGARVELHGLLGGGRIDPCFRRTTRTRDGGAFRFGGLPEGRYLLSFRPVGAGAEAGAASLVPVEVPEVRAGTHGLVVRMPRGRVIEGRIETDRGEPVVPTGWVYVYPSGRSAADPSAVLADLAADGTFRTPPLRDDRSFDIEVTRFRGFFDAVHAGVLPGAPPVLVALRPALEITGRVLDAKGRPVPAGVPVVASAPGVGPAVEGAGSATCTRVGGVFVLRGLGEFDYTLRAGAGSSRYRLAEPTPDIRAGSEDVELRVVEGVEISGRLVAADGLPVRAVQIRGIQTDGSSAVFHLSRPDGGDGGFVLRGLVSGEVKVQADFGSGFVDLGTVQVPAEASNARVLFRSSGHLR